MRNVRFREGQDQDPSLKSNPKQSHAPSPRHDSPQCVRLGSAMPWSVVRLAVLMETLEECGLPQDSTPAGIAAQERARKFHLLWQPGIWAGKRGLRPGMLLCSLN